MEERHDDDARGGGRVVMEVEAVQVALAAHVESGLEGCFPGYR